MLTLACSLGQHVVVRAVLVIASLIAACVAARPALACTCPQDAPPKIELEASSAVFVGRLEVVPALGNPEPFEVEDGYDPTRRIFTFEVIHAYKSGLERGTRVWVESNADEAACGRSYAAVGDLWLVYASGAPGEGRLHDHLCSRSRPIEAARRDLRALAALSPEPPPPDEPPFVRCASTGTEPGRRGAPVSLMMIVGLWAWRRRARGS